MDSSALTTPPAVPALAGSFWCSVREALRGSRQDYTEAPLGRAILLLAVPMVLEMAMESIFAVVDVFFVSRLGPDAVATVGLTESMLTLLYALAMGLSIGAMATVARRIGERDADAAATSAVQAIVLGIAVALPVAVLGCIFARPLLAMMGGSPWVLEQGVKFTRIEFASIGSITLLFLINAIFRGAGDPVIAMRVLILANGLNIVLGPCFIFGLGPFPRLGVMGAAVATTLGRTTGVLVQLWALSRPNGRIAIRRRHLRIEPKTLLGMVRISGSAVIQLLVGMTSWIGLVRIVSLFGSAALAGYTIAIRLVIFALLPSFGMSNAAATLVGQNLGAKKPERAEAAVWRAGFYNLVFLGTVGLVFVLAAVPIVRAFSSDPEVLAVGVRGLRIISAGFVFYAYGMVLTQAFNGAGDTWTPTWVNFACFWVFELPLAWVLARPLGLGPTGAFVAAALAFSSIAVVSGLLFRRGRWKTKTV